MKTDITLFNIGNDCLASIKRQGWFPYKTGNLRDNATYGRLKSKNVYEITFDTTIAPYIPYLEYGTEPHDIPNAFGNGENFGVGGKFDGKFHPGSKKHVGFIHTKSFNEIQNFITRTYNATKTK